MGKEILKYIKTKTYHEMTHIYYIYLNFKIFWNKSIKISFILKTKYKEELYYVKILI